MKRAFATLLVLGTLAAILLLLGPDSWPLGDGARDGARDDSGPRGASAPAAVSRRTVDVAADGSGPDYPEGTIRGRVHDAAGAGIGGARIRVVAMNEALAPEAAAGVTDDSGVFEITASGGTAFSVFAEASGYAPTHETLVRIGDEVDFELVPSPALEGLVVDDQGSPVAGASVVYFCTSGGHEIERKATSDAEGRWRLTGLTVNQDLSTWLSAQAPGFAPYLSRQLWGTTLEGNVRFTVILRRGASILARVVDAATGAPIGGATVSVARSLMIGGDRLAARRFGPVASVAADAGGIARISRVSGSDFVGNLVWLARAPGYAEAVEELPDTRDGQELRLESRLWKSATLAGRVVDQRGRPVPGTRVAIRNWYEARGGVANEPSGCLAGADGGFRLEAPCSPEGVGITLTKDSGRRGLGKAGPFNAAPGATLEVGDVVIELAPTAVIRVLDPARRPLAGAVIDVDSFRAENRRFVTGADGGALLSFDAYLENCEESVRVSARGFVEVEKCVVPTAGEPSAVEVVLLRATELRCRVTWADASPAAGITVGVAHGGNPIASIWPIRNEPPRRDASDEACLGFLQTDERGQCRFAGIDAGPWHVAAWREERDLEPAIRVPSVTDSTKEVVMRLDEPRPASRPSVDAVEVEIRVVDSVSGAAILDPNVFFDDGRPALPAAPGVFRANVPRSVIRVSAYSRDYPKGWNRRVDFSLPGSEKLQIRLDPGVSIKGRARLPAGVPITGARIHCSWPERSHRSAPVLATGEFELTGLAVGEPLDFLVQIPFRQGSWNFVPMPYVATVVPVGVKEMAVDLDLVPGTSLTIWVQDLRRHGALDPWEVEITGTTPTWWRDWRVSGVVFRATVPSGQAVARCHVADAAARVHNLELTSDACFQPVVIR